MMLTSSRYWTYCGKKCGRKIGRKGYAFAGTTKWATFQSKCGNSRRFGDFGVIFGRYGLLTHFGVSHRELDSAIDRMRGDE